MEENEALYIFKPTHSVRVLLGLSIDEAKEPLKPTTGTPTLAPEGLWQIPQIRDAIPKLVSVVEWYYKDRSKSNLKITYIFVALLAGLTLGVSVMAFNKMVEGGTVIFLVGSLFGYVFAFLQRYLGPSA